ncbi:outer membrane protein OmpA-like peptidoglycan-associated protein [Arcicella aurantiaca]|uniref:Outer membrane protein OmpA-like peptidoglycan-associated protein n=1 Tax=Arcicella aurantiaca TaxID=591202 RepID=A0A316EAW5_9BACT|nr:OmpA family protein [Arcicella aurantiaca]PWK27941.1 outer membrane protein OmpA-like peptidoglycan-associated protein [Arcicella aurantiaca]
MKNIVLLFIFLFLLNSEDIIAQVKTAEPIKKYQLQIKAYDYDTRDDLEGTYIKLYNLTKKKLADSAVVMNGYATFMLEKGNDYDLLGQRTRYMSKRGNFNAACYLQDPKKVFCVSGISIENVSKQPNGVDLVEGAITLKKIKIDDSFKIENIRYDLNKWDIRPDAAKELDNLVQILRDNPNIVVELGSHTDSRASDDYNLTLSQKRAEAAVKYIIEKGRIPSNRISAKGYGETKLLNKCDDGVACTELEHAMNRRTEIRITGYLVDGVPVDLKGGSAVSGDRN